MNGRAIVLVASATTAALSPAYAQTPYDRSQQTIRQQQQIQQQQQMQQQQRQLEYEQQRARAQEEARRAREASRQPSSPSGSYSAPSSGSNYQSPQQSAPTPQATPPRQQTYQQYMLERERRQQEQARIEAYWKAKDDFKWRCVKEERLEQPECKHIREQIAYEALFHRVRERISSKAWADYRTLNRVPPGMEQDLRRLEELGNRWRLATDEWDKLGKQEQDLREARGRLAAQNAGKRRSAPEQVESEWGYFLRLEPSQSGLKDFWDCVYTRVNGQEFRATPSGGANPRCQDRTLYVIYPPKPDPEALRTSQSTLSIESSQNPPRSAPNALTSAPQSFHQPQVAVPASAPSLPQPRTSPATDALEKARVAYAQGDPLWGNHKYKEAVPHFSEAVRLAPDNTLYLYRLGASLAKSGDPQAGLPHLQKAVALAEGRMGDPRADRDSWAAAFNMGLATALADLGQWTEALRATDRARSQDPDNPWNKRDREALLARAPAAMKR